MARWFATDGDAGELPDWYVPLEMLRNAADFLRCSVLDVADADPRWRRAALTVLRAQAEAKTHKTPAT